MTWTERGFDAARDRWLERMQDRYDAVRDEDEDEADDSHLCEGDDR